MNDDCFAIRDDLPGYAAHTIDAHRREVVAEHLAGCADCRREFAIWQAASRQITAEDDALLQPAAALLEDVFGTLRADAARRPVAEHLWLLVKSQIPLVRREIWLTSAFVIVMGCVLSMALHQGNPDFLVVLAPLMTAAGVAMIYGPENDPALELALATPTSSRQVLLARLFLVFGYDLILALAGSIVLTTWGAWSGALSELVLSWLAPMTFLSALALALSVWIGAGNAAAIAFTAWIAAWEVSVVGRQYEAGVGWNPLAATAITLARWASDPALLFGLAALMLAIAVWTVGRSANMHDAASA